MTTWCPRVATALARAAMVASSPFERGDIAPSASLLRWLFVAATQPLLERPTRPRTPRDETHIFVSTSVSLNDHGGKINIMNASIWG